MQTSGRSGWVVAICSVVFDLDVGQQMETVYPTAAISEMTATSVAFHSFPVSTRDDRQFGCEADHTTPNALQLNVVCIVPVWSRGGNQLTLNTLQLNVVCIVPVWSRGGNQLTDPAHAGFHVHGVTV